LEGREKLRLETSARSHLAAPTSSRSCLQRSRFVAPLMLRCIEARSAHNLRASLAIRVCAKSVCKEAVLRVTPVADNRVSASERTATTVQVCRSASMFSAASLTIYWMDVHICASFQLRSVPTLQLQVDLANFAYLPDPTSSLARSRCAIMHSLAILRFDKRSCQWPGHRVLAPTCTSTLECGRALTHGSLGSQRRGS
jgi:hypothetical protein